MVVDGLRRLVPVDFSVFSFEDVAVGGGIMILFLGGDRACCVVFDGFDEEWGADGLYVGFERFGGIGF